MDAAIREVTEETGVRIRITGLSGVYTDPGHVMIYPTGEVRQQFALCLHAVPVSGHPQANGHEIISAAWHDVATIDQLPIHPACDCASITPSPTRSTSS